MRKNFFSFYQLVVSAKKLIRNRIPEHSFLWPLLRAIRSFFYCCFSWCFHRPLKRAFRILIKGKQGLEIGGPTKIFEDRNILPLYGLVAALDGCNVSENTPWQGTIVGGQTYRFHPRKPAGKQWFAEAVSLSSFETGAYDFLLASHVLEHIANPLKALKEWFRVVKQEGVVLIILPDPQETFDCNRKVTALDHLIEDYNNNTGEDDRSHVNEVIAMHQVSLDPSLRHGVDLKERIKENARDRYVHHHVFDILLLQDIFGYLQQRILIIERVLPFHIVCLVKKVA